MSAIRLLLVEDHRLVRESLRALLGEEFQIVEAGNAAEALAQAAFKPEIILLDLSLPDLDGLALLRRLREQGIQAKVLVLSMHAAPEHVLAAAEAGASGYLLKEDSAEELLRAIHWALQHDPGPKNFYLSRGLERAGLRELLCGKRALLTPRERAVLELLAQGLKASEIAARLGISVKTVETHQRNIRRKLGLRSRAELVRYALSRANRAKTKDRA